MSGVTALTLLIAGWIIYHERTCAERWQNFLESHGQLTARIEASLERIKRLESHEWSRLTHRKERTPDPDGE